MAENEIQDNFQPPELPPRVIRQNPGLQLIRTPPILKLSMDLDTYLRRFNSYAQSIGATPADLPHLLINSLDEETLQYLERHLGDDITMADLIRVLRREMGISRLNREEYKAKLRKTMRARSENVRSYYSKLWNLAKRAWPDNEEVREANLRDAFIANFQDSSISARLRERPEVDNEALLDHAQTLVNCKNASLSRQTEVNASLIEPYPSPTALDQDVEAAIPIGTPNSESTLSWQMNQLIDLLANVNISSASNQYSGNQLDRHNRGAYRGDHRSAVLEDRFRRNSYNHNYRRDGHHSGYRSYSRGNYSYHPTPKHSFNFRNQGQYRPYQDQGEYRPYQDN